MIAAADTRHPARPGPRPGRTAGTGRTAGRSAACAMPAVADSVPALRRFARGAARRWALPDSVDEALALIVTELAANAVRHSGSADVALLLAVDGVTVTVQVKDAGTWRARPNPPGPAAEAEACGGRGLQLVEAYAAGFALWRTAGGTRVVAELLLPDPQPVPVAEHRR
ncbi:hypothetical protein GCM10010193_52600 [Kitasatospora atroaurantiaca]|uniref:Anti-sigma regulatory factor (Ser/Thr protein kinase) n=1 Tax=Kitasatospora atroaurantiaca TaxID=285545 RepID=A0A561EXP3_9ACTN|nr:ATP-binding protein [Kitasatospora atroaurantiaca]TWE20371.1 anti-sigma regulatory factor (Ser/Thr protein kinase) [Kitasatospora atroaurantiaca]